MREPSARFVSPLVKELRKLFGHFYARGDGWTAGRGEFIASAVLAAVTTYANARLSAEMSLFSEMFGGECVTEIGGVKRKGARASRRLFTGIF